MTRFFTILCLLLLILGYKSTAQSRNNYTSGNTILIAVESTEGLYEYTSDQLLVRYNENTQKMECIFNVNALLPANDSSPVVIVQDMFFASKNPQQLIEIDVPQGNLQATAAATQANNRKARLLFQEVPIDLLIPVTFSPDNRMLLFSTSFDLLLPDYQIAVPAKYIPMLTGRIIFTIRNAQWVDQGTR